MNALSIIATIIATAVIVGLGAFAVFRLIGVELRRRHMEVGTAIFLQLGVIYAVFLAFVFGQALTGFVVADDSIDAECAALHGAAILGRGLPPAEHSALKTNIAAYIANVIDAEWITMRDHRRGSLDASAKEEQLLTLVNRWSFKDAGQTAIQSRILDLLIKAHAERERRLFEARQGIPVGLWVMILIYCVALIVLVLFASLEYVWSHTILAGAFGGLNALVLVAVFLLQYPFEGPFRLSADSFQTTKDRVMYLD